MRLAFIVLGVTVGGFAAAAQTARPPSPRFEVASVKPNTSADPHGTIVTQPGGRYVAINVPVRQLITQAFGLQSSQLVDGPEWSRTDRFDVTAKADGEIQSADGLQGTGALQLMLQALLAERFKLVVRREARDLPIYVLVLAKSDRTLGPKLRVSATDCSADSAARSRAGGPPAGPPSFSDPLTCGLRMAHGRLAAADATMAQLVVSLSSSVQRVVRDGTGLTGRYNMEMSWVPESMAQAAISTTPSALPPIDPNGTSIFTALQDQLGLKLESARGPVDVVVIDSVERPTIN